MGSKREVIVIMQELHIGVYTYVFASISYASRMDSTPANVRRCGVWRQVLKGFIDENTMKVIMIVYAVMYHCISYS